MTDPGGPVTDPEPDDESRGPVTLGQVVFLCAAGLVGGVVGALVLGVVGVFLGGAAARGQNTEAEGISGCMGGMLGAVLGLPLGVAVGLRVAGRKLGTRSRFWPALGASYAGILAWLSLLVLLQYLVNRTHLPAAVVNFQPFLLYAGPFVLSLAGGLIGYLRFRRPRPSASL